MWLYFLPQSLFFKNLDNLYSSYCAETAGKRCRILSLITWSSLIKNRASILCYWDYNHHKIMAKSQIVILRSYANHLLILLWVNSHEINQRILCFTNKMRACILILPSFWRSDNWGLDDWVRTTITWIRFYPLYASNFFETVQSTLFFDSLV